MGRVSDAGRLRDVAAYSAAGVRKPPRKETALGGREAVPRALWGFERRAQETADDVSLLCLTNHTDTAVAVKALRNYSTDRPPTAWLPERVWPPRGSCAEAIDPDDSIAVATKNVAAFRETLRITHLQVRRRQLALMASTQI